MERLHEENTLDHHPCIINLIHQDERLLIIEDADEIQARPGDLVRRFVTGVADPRRHVFEAPARPSQPHHNRRSTRAGSARHAGGRHHRPSQRLSTIHANSRDEMLTRLAHMAQCDQSFIREAIDLVVFIEITPDGWRDSQLRRSRFRAAPL